MRGVLPRAAGAGHAVTLDRLDEQDRRLALVLHGRLVRGVHLERVVPAAFESRDPGVRQVFDERLQLRRVEEVLADERAAPLHVFLFGQERLVPGFVRRPHVAADVLLVLAVHHFHHAASEGPGVIGTKQGIPVRTPYELDDVPAGTAEDAFEFLDDLAVAANGSVEPLQITVDDPGEVVEFFAAGEADAAEGFGFVAFAVAEERPDAHAIGLCEFAVVQVPIEASVVDAHDRAETHANGGVLPEVWHQPRVRVAAEAAALAEFLAEILEAGFIESAFEKRTSVHAGAGVTLEEDDVAGETIGATAEEVVEADLVQRGGGGVSADVPADVGVLVRLEHHGHGVPSNEALDAAFDLAVAGEGGLVVGGNRVDVRRGDAEGHAAEAGLGDLADEGVEQELGAFGAAVADHGLHRFEPVGGFLGIGIVRQPTLASQHVGTDQHRREPHGGGCEQESCVAGGSTLA